MVFGSSACLGTEPTDPSNGVSAVSGDAWTSLRGSLGHGHADGTLPDSWTDAEYAWRIPLGRRDVGSVVIANQQCFFLAHDATKNSISLRCVSMNDGSSIWQRSFPLGAYAMHARNSYAASTPTISGDKIYIAYADDQHTYVRCLDLEGGDVWVRDFGPWQSDHGFSTSPAIINGLCVLYDSQQADELPPGKQPSHERMIAVDAQTGDDRWMTPLTATRTCYGISSGYESPEGSTQVVNAGTGDGIFSLDARTGKVAWSIPVFDKRIVSSPIVVGDIVLAACGSGGGGNAIVAVKMPGRSSDDPQVLYRIERGAAYVPTCAIDGDHALMISDNGIATRFRISDGKIAASGRIGGNYGSSPIVVGDKVLAISLDGVATIMNATSLAKRGEVRLGGPVGASPAFANGRLILRVDDELRCLWTGDEM